MSDQHNARSLLLDLGIGDFNATMIIPMMFMGPAQCDPDLTQMKLLVKAMQRVMQQMGATWIVAHGRLDANTSACLATLMGRGWTEVAWFDIVTQLNAAKAAGRSFQRPPFARGVDLGSIPDVSAIPGGWITLGIAGYLGYRHFTKGR